jgi:peptide/nickel transport system ATP-binding protein
VHELFTRPSHPRTIEMMAAARKSAAVPKLQSEDDSPLLQVNNIAVSFRGKAAARKRPLNAVLPVKFELRRAETLAIVGESGSGKTSLARAILGLVVAQGGTTLFLEQPLAKSVEARPAAIRSRMQMVFQDPVGSLNPAMRVHTTAGASSPG